jgi:hypothetical protein
MPPRAATLLTARAVPDYYQKITTVTSAAYKPGSRSPVLDIEAGPISQWAP